MKKLLLIFMILFTGKVQAFEKKFSISDIIVTISPLGKESSGPLDTQKYLVTATKGEVTLLNKECSLQGCIEKIKDNGFHCFYISVHQKKPGTRQYQFVKYYYKLEITETSQYSVEKSSHDKYREDIRQGRNTNKILKKQNK